MSFSFPEVGGGGTVSASPQASSPIQQSAAAATAPAPQPPPQSSSESSPSVAAATAPAEPPDPMTVFALELLAEINLLRTQPRVYAAAALTKNLQYFKGKELCIPGETILLTHEGAAAVRSAIDFLNTMRPVRPLTGLSFGMCRAAQDHVDDIGSTGVKSTSSSDGSSPFDRLDRHGKWTGRSSEVIFFGSETSARGVVASWVINDGDELRPDRECLLCEEYSFLGAAHGPHRSSRHMAVANFCTAFEELPSNSDAVRRLTSHVPVGVRSEALTSSPPVVISSAVTPSPPPPPPPPPSFTQTVSQESSPAPVALNTTESASAPTPSRNCGGCGLSVANCPRILDALDARWHVECFVCCNPNCNKNLQGTNFVSENGKPLCIDCADANAELCGGCGLPLKSGTFLEALNKSWHIDCFVCHKCHQPFPGGRFKLVGGHPHCSKC
eukprot:gnl/Spiro4/1499_TR809_c0_g1_i1.p1 gnl/Spiro4/1499_TR809_c0_g1~~gnl/Spiro4/1499_TR809_c0_g1_i1.p1  ORF type:complete len:514 (+),score=91.08 gnl/Spiro4/1499_TR809_c0_g1_i1:217-1542(+)